MEPLEERHLLSTFTVTTTSPSGPGSFEQAILDANGRDAGRRTKQDTIVFNIPPQDPGHVYYRDDGVAGQVTTDNVASTTAANDASITDIDPDWPHSWYSIKPNQRLGITYPVIIDGYTQAGAVANSSIDTFNGILRIEIDGSNVDDSLFQPRGGNVIRGLVINSPTVTQGNEIYFRTDGNNVVTGNLIGTDVSGTLALGKGHGILVTANNNQIGGRSPESRNIISGNRSAGIWISGNRPGNVIEGNFVGVAADGSTPLANGLAGIFLNNNAVETTIGGSEPGAGNVIAYNDGYGITVGPSPNGNNLIQGNLIFSNESYGINSAGTGTQILENQILGNASHGVVVTTGSDQRVQSNTITGNGAAGVLIGSNGFAAISSNSIASNGGLGIDLSGGDEDSFGVTANDPLDADTGPNHLQNHPLVTSVTRASQGTSIGGLLSSSADSDYLVQFFTSENVDPSGYGEGEIYLGEITVQTDSTGVAHFFETVSGSVPAGYVVTATATRLVDVGGELQPAETSEFSPPNQNPVAGAIRWDGGGDGTSWDDPLNWEGDLLPGPNEDVTIDVADADPEIVFRNGTVFVHRLISNEPFRLEGGTLAIGGESQFNANFTLTGSGVLSGGGTVTMSDAFTWSSGTMSGPGTTISTANWTIQGDAPKFAVDTRALVNRGQLVWRGNGEVFRGRDEPTFTNAAGAVFSIETDSDFLAGPVLGGTFLNEGVLEKSQQAGTASIKSPVTNRGTVLASSGTLRFAAGYTQVTGTTTLISSNIESPQELRIEGGVLEGTGSVIADLANSATVRPGGLREIGALSITGNYTQAATGRLEFDISDSPANDVLHVAGIANLDGTLQAIVADNALLQLGSTFEVLTYASSAGAFSAMEGFNQAGGQFFPETHATDLSLVFSDGVDVPLVSRQLADGLDAVRTHLPEWLSLFDLGNFASTGQSVSQVAGLNLDLASSFALVDAGQGFEVPVVPVVNTIAELENRLDALKQEPWSVTVDCLAGETIDEASCDPGDFVQLRFEQTVQGLSAQVPWNNSNARGILEGLAESAELSGTLDMTAEATLTLVVGVDETGFYLDRASGIELRIAGGGSVDVGTVDIGGSSTSASGAANIDAQAAIAPHSAIDRHRMDVVSGAPASLFLLSAQGFTAVELDATVGPFDLAWRSTFDAGIDPEPRHELSAEFTLPGWEDRTGSEAMPARFLLAGTTNGDGDWLLSSQTKGDFSFAGGVIDILDPQFQLALTASEASGTTQAGIRVPGGSGGVSNTLAQSLTGTITLDRLEWNGNWNRTSLGLQHSASSDPVVELAAPSFTASVGADFSSGAPFGTVTMSANNATVAPSRVVRGELTGVEATLSGDGRITITADRLNVDLGEAFRLESPGVVLTIDPSAAGTDPMLALGASNVTLPSLERAGATPSFETSDFGFRHNGQAFIGDPASAASSTTFDLFLPASHPDSLGIAGIAPLTIEKISVTFPSSDVAHPSVGVQGQLDLAPLEVASGGSVSVSIKDASGSTVSTSGSFSVPLSVGELAAGRLRVSELSEIVIEFDAAAIAGLTADVDVVVSDLDADGRSAGVAGTVLITAGDAVFPTNLSLNVDGSLDYNGDRASIELDGVAELGTGDAHARAVFQGTIGAGLGVGSAAPNDFGAELDLQLLEGQASANVDFTIPDVLRLTGDVAVTSGGVTLLADAKIDFLGALDALPAVGVEGVVRNSDGSIEIAAATVEFGDVSLGSVASFANLTVTIGDLGLSFDSDGGVVVAPGATVHVAAESASILPAGNIFTTTFAAPSGMLDLTGTSAGRLHLTTAELAVDVADTGLSLAAVDASLDLPATITPGQNILTASAATVTLPLLGDQSIQLAAQNLALAENGQFTLGSASLTAQDGLADAIGIAGLLPFDVTQVTLSPIVAEAPLLLNKFNIELTGEFSFGVLESLFGALPGRPVLNIGGAKADTSVPNQFDVAGGAELSSADATSNAFDIVFSIDTDRPQVIQIADLGPIFIGLRELEFGPMTANAWIDLGAYQDGRFSGDFAASIDVDLQTAAADIQGGLAVSGNLDLSSPAEAMLDVAIELTAGFQSESVPVEFRDLSLSFETELNVDRSTFETVAQPPSLTGLSVGEVRVHVFDVLELVATEAAIGLDSSQPFLIFGGDADTETGSLSLEFGSDTPLQGLGGLMGHFGVGFTPENGFQFYFLDRFFTKVLAPDDFNFGLPDWLPIAVREIGVQFNESPDKVVGGIWDGTTNAGDLSNVRLLFSGGLEGNELFPITGQVEDMVIDIPKLVTCMETFIAQNGNDSTAAGYWSTFGAHAAQNCSGEQNPIENLDAVEFGVEEIQLGPITIGGVLGLGTLDIPLDENDPTGPTRDVWYGRIMGQFAYADSGIGIELVLTEFGPVLARIFAGVPIPIGMLVGAIVGTAVPGIGTAAGTSVGKQSGFLLTGLEGGLIFGGERLPVVEKPIEILESDLFHDPFSISIDKVIDAVGDSVRKSAADPDNPTYTWSNGFTFAGSGVLTNEYVAGMIGGRLTLGANVGYADQVGAQLFGIGDIEVVGLDLASAGVLFDYREPLEPTFNMAFSLPGTPGNPLAMILPVQGQLGARIETTGISEAAALATAKMLRELQAGIIDSSSAGLELGQEFFASVFDVMARVVEASRKSALESAAAADRQTGRPGTPVSRFARLVLDRNLDGNLPLDELQSIVFTPQTLLSRLTELIGDEVAGNPAVATEVADSLMRELLDVGGSILTVANAAESERESLTTSYLVRLGIGQAADVAELVASIIGATQEFVGELNQPGSIELLAPFARNLLPDDFELEPFDSVLPLPQRAVDAFGYTQARVDNTLQILSVLRKSIQDRFATAVAGTGDQLWEVIDPSLTIEGALVPTVLGIPVADPEAEGSLRLDKHGLTVDIDTTLAGLSAPFSFHPYSTAALAAIIALGSDPSVGMSMSLPLGNVVGEILLPGIDPPNPGQPAGAPGVFDSFLDPFDQDWGIELRTSVRLFHFDTAIFKGLAIVPPLTGTRTELNAFAESRIQKLWDNPESDIDPDRVPIFDQAHYQSLLDYGGILLNGLVRVPKIITDPVEFLSRDDLQLADNPTAIDYLQWSQALVGALDEADTPGLFQVFLPSYASAIDIDLIADADEPGSLPPADCVVPTFSQQGVRFDAPAGSVDACRVHLVDEGVVDEISQAAYFEGAWGKFTDPAGEITEIDEAKILGIPVGKGRVTWTESGGLQLAFLEPILAKEVVLAFSSRDVDVTPINRPALSLALPQAAIDIELSTSEFATALENLGLPSAAFQPVDDPAPSASAYYRAYSPGFSADMRAGSLQLEGGVEFGGRISLPPLLEAQTAFEYSMSISPDTGLPQLESFSGRGMVDSFSPIGPAIPLDLLDFSDVFLEITHDGALVPEIRFGGSLTLVGHEFSFDSADGVTFVADGFVGSIELNPEFLGGFSVGPAGYELEFGPSEEVGFRLEIDTRPGRQSVIRVTGNATLGGFGLTEGTFDFGAGPDGRLSISATGNMRGPGLGELTLEQGALLLSPLGLDLAASLSFQSSTPAEIAGNIHLSGEFDFAMNSFEESIVLDGRSIPAGTVATVVGIGQVGIPPVNLELDGALEFSIGDNGIKADIGAGGLDVSTLFGVSPSLLPDWLFPGGTPLTVNSGFFELSDDGTVEFSNMQLFDLTGSVKLLAGSVTADVDLNLNGNLSDPHNLLSGNVSGVLTWLVPSPDGTSKPVTIGAIGGDLDGNGCLTASISTPFFDSSESVALVPGACEPHLTISGSSVREGDFGTEVQLQLSQPLDKKVTVRYSIEVVSESLGDLHPADESDFIVETGSVTIPKGRTQADINVAIIDDDDIEFDEILRVRITDVTNLTRDFVNNDRVLVVIANDDRLELFPQISTKPFFAYDFELEHEYTKFLPDEIAEPGPDADSKAGGTSVDAGRVIQQGLSQFVGDDDIPPLRAEVRSFGYELNPAGTTNEVFEFTVNLPSLTVFEKLRFWSSPIAGDDEAGEPEFDVYWSIDDYSEPLAAPPVFKIENNLFGEDFAEVLKDGGVTEGLLGWQKYEAKIDTVATGLLCSSGDVTFRIQGRQTGTVYLDNIELFARAANPLDNCLGSEDEVVVTGQVIELLDPSYGDVLLELIGPGSINASYRPIAGGRGVTDPIETSQLTSIVLTGTTNESQLRIGVENTRTRQPLTLGRLSSDGPLGSFFARSVASLSGRFEFASLDSFIGRGLTSGSSLISGGSSGAATSLMLFGDVGNVNVSGPGVFDIASRSWSGGQWTVGELADVLTTDGDLGASMSIAGGFDSIRVVGGDLTSRLIETGTGFEVGDGNSGAIQVQTDSSGEGGSVLVDHLVIDGNLEQLSAEGGNLRASITANQVGAIVSTSLDGPLGGGDIAGTIVVDAISSISSYGGDITASLKTLHPEHPPLSISAEADLLGRGGRIDSPHSFLIAGAIDRIAAHRILLHLEADRNVELIEVVSQGTAPGSIEGSFSAQRFGMVRGEADKANFSLFSREAQPGAARQTSLRVNDRNGGNGEGESDGGKVLMIDIREPVGVLQVAFDESDPEAVVPLQFSALEAVLVPIHRPGAAVAGLSESMQGPFELSDDRFTVVDNVLRLKADQQLTADDREVTVTVTEAANTSMRQSFIIDLFDPSAANPWHNSTLASDVNGDGVVTPRDALLVVDALSNPNGQELSLPPPTPHDFLDVTDDQNLSPADALAVVEYLNRPDDGEAEGPLTAGGLGNDEDWQELVDQILALDPVTSDLGTDRL